MVKILCYVTEWIINSLLNSSSGVVRVARLEVCPLFIVLFFEHTIVHRTWWLLAHNILIYSLKTQNLRRPPTQVAPKELQPSMGPRPFSEEPPPAFV